MVNKAYEVFYLENVSRVYREHTIHVVKIERKTYSGL